MSSRLPLQSRANRPKFENKRAIFGEDEDEVERIHDERVLGFEDNRIKEAEPKPEVKPLSISPLPNLDWRANTRQNKERFLPARAQPEQEESTTEILDQSSNLYGLQVQTKKKEVVQVDATVTTTESVVTTTATSELQPEVVEKTLEERAVEAIIKESLGDGIEEEDKGPKKVITMDETAAFREDVVNRPDETTMEDYENIPVEEFGAALLRGLGWSEGEGIGRNRKNSPAPPPPPVKQREALLGLGAKPEESDGQSQREKAAKKRSAYEYKDTSLFKKISKRKIEDALHDDEYDRGSRSSSQRYNDRDDRYSKSNSSSRSSSKRRRSRSRDRYSRSGSDSSSSSTSSRRHRSRSRESSRHKSSRRRDRS